ncbi:MAG: glycosyltransferase family 2 protein [Prevotella sp.]|nr:glycosyltransferase family 2 protein [Prevotella sp.]
MYTPGLVSVVIPTYKRSETLERAINSVRNQTYRDIEILVVDDNVPGDAYSQSVKQLTDRLAYDNVTLVTQPKHINGAAARNAGIRKSKGEYISFLDDDDLIFPDKIEKQVAALKKMDESVGGVSSLKIFFKGHELTHISDTWECTDDQSLRVMSKQLNIQTCTVLLRRKCLDETGYFDEHLFRHQEVQLMSYFTNKYKIILLNEVLTIIDGSDLSNRPDYEKLKEYKTAYFKAMSPLMEKYSKRQCDFIYKNHMTELAWVMFRDTSKVKGLLMLAKCFQNIKVLVSFIKRLNDKKEGVKRLANYKQKDYVLSLIKS